MSNVDLIEIVGILTRLESRASGVWISHLATTEKLEQLAETPWHDPDLDQYANKTRMKEFGAAGMNFKSFIMESLIAGLASSLETFWIDLRLTTRLKYDIWKSPLKPAYEHEARIIRCIGNVVKHNQSIIESSKSEHAKFLVAQAGFPDQISLKTLFLSDSPLLKADDLNYSVYLYCLDLIRLDTGFGHPVLSMAEPERRARVIQHLVPRVLQLNAT
ncbi:MAG: hypothetical protein EON54_03875 [Alcaligenaceae bacterium]|nr:MAG: hypothetical protein EON54_03875 [Alcaligenaceae bacterium]